MNASTLSSASNDSSANGSSCGVAFDEVQALEVVPILGEFDAGRVQVQPGVGRRVQGAHQIGRATAVAAAALQDLLAAEVRLGGRAVIELDEEPVRLVGSVSGIPSGGSSSYP